MQKFAGCSPLDKKSRLLGLQKTFLNSQLEFFLNGCLPVLETSFKRSEIQALFMEMGRESAKQADLTDLTNNLTLDTLVEVLNAHWKDAQWGGCTVYEADQAIYIEHYFAPTVSFSPSDSLLCFLAGAYEYWLRRLSTPYLGKINQNKMYWDEFKYTFVYEL